MATNKIQTGIRFEPELLYKITWIAKENKRSLNAQLEYLAQICVREYEQSNSPIPVDEERLYNKLYIQKRRGAKPRLFSVKLGFIALGAKCKM